MFFENLQVVFFDFDGVLVDSNEVKADAYAALFEDPDVAARVRAHHLANGGMSRFEKFRLYSREYLGKELDDAGLDDYCRRFGELVVEKVVAAPEIPGAMEFLMRASARRPCIVVTATPTEEITGIMRRRGLDKVVDAVLGSPRLKGENIAATLRERGLDPARCLFIGDSGNDLRASLSCKVPFAGIRSPMNRGVEREHPECAWYDDFNAMLDHVIPGRAAFRAARAEQA